MPDNLSVGEVKRHCDRALERPSKRMTAKPRVAVTVGPSVRDIDQRLGVIHVGVARDGEKVTDARLGRAGSTSRAKGMPSAKG